MVKKGPRVSYVSYLCMPRQLCRRFSIIRLFLYVGIPCLGFLFISNYYGRHMFVINREVFNSLANGTKHHHSAVDVGTREILAKPAPSEFKQPEPTQPQQKCVLPALQLDDPLMMSFVKQPVKLRCPPNPADWAQIVNGTLVYSKEVRARVGDFTCDLSPLVRPPNDDAKIKWGAKMKNFTDGGKIPSDAFKLECRRKNAPPPVLNETVTVSPPEPVQRGKPGGRRVVRRPVQPTDGYEYSDVLWGVAPNNQAVWKRLAETKPDPDGLSGLSVLMLGFDSMSRMSWTRRMKQTREYAVTTLGGIELEGYNIMGDGTPAALFPILTGKHEQELPEARRNHAGSQPVDRYPWIWKDFATSGYVTSWADAEWTIAPFNYRLRGFAQPPTDYFARPYYLGISDNSRRTHHQNFCRGPVTQHQVWFNFVRDLHLMYGNKPKFLMHFYATLSHGDNNLLIQADEDLKNLLHYLETQGYLDSTILVLFGDHGARFNNVRQTWAGKLEERLPYMMWRFPPWFQQKYPQLMKNFRSNVKRLTTPMDIHETLRDILKFDNAGKGNTTQRGISLFKEIPAERDCSEADISTHWCACLDWKHINKPETDAGAKSAAKAASLFINNLTKPHRDLCAELTVSNISFAAKLEANDAVLTFQKAADKDGYVPLFDQAAKSRLKESLVIYQVTFFTQPGNGNFEVTISQKGNQWTTSEKEISRINAYGNDPSCILDINRQLRQFCYCDKKIK